MKWRKNQSRSEASDDLLVGPIRGDLLGAEHLAARARTVAGEQHIALSRTPLRPARLLARLADTRRILRDAQVRLTAATADGVDAGPAAEWLLDNYHVVQDELQEVRTALPRGYYRELPELTGGGLSGYPRVYEIAITLISHSEARIDLENVDLFVAAFQSVTPLSVGELWAMPAMLRLGLIESVRRMTLRTVQRLDELEQAEVWADRILSASADGGAGLRAELRDFAGAGHPLTPHFTSRFLQLLRQGEGTAPAVAWIEHWMAEEGVTPDRVAAESTQRLALTRIMMANSIMSLRNIGRLDWRSFVERQSEMEAVLRQDPSGFYPLMTFATRDRYRHVVEHLAMRTGHREAAVAQWALGLCRRDSEPIGGETEQRRAHVGFWLVGEGLVELERISGFVPGLGERVERMVRTHPNVVFIGGVALGTALTILALFLLAGGAAEAAFWLVLIFAFLPALDISVNVLNQLVTNWLPPRVLPRLDLHQNGIPAEYRTAVVVPTLFGNTGDVRDALENLEVQFLANREAHVHFAILSDFTDAAAEHEPGDEAIVAAAVDGIRALNERYAADRDDRFHLLHRPRRWNPQQGVWMGWERKRGKLAEFNRLLRGGATSAFSVVTGDTSALLNVKYVITLDSDTVLPPGAAPALIGAMAHPLNRAEYDPVRKHVVRGYGILQPRVGISLPSAHRSHFAAIASGHPGVDPYSVAVSDLYQDLYGEGSFTGKGIYDVDAFQQATFGRFPENMLLSHDLIEGNYARAGLATDVIVYDDYPSSYVAFTRRKHRWIRGDWQLLPWLRRNVPGPDGPEPNRLSLLSRWKIVDNLRRSTVELAQLALLVAGWILLPGSPLRWTMLGLAAIVAPWATSLIIAALRPPLDKSWRAYYAAVGQDAVICVKQAAMTIVFLPHQAFASADAIVRTLYRLLVSRRHLLEWQSAGLVERSVSDIPAQTWRAMRTATLLLAAGIVAVFYALLRNEPRGTVSLTLLVTGVLWLSWLLAPLLASAVSAMAVTARRELSAAARESARRYASLHWHYFDTFVTEATHWLAPDNYQVDPEPVVAMRTSPTNIGLHLLATISARDLDLITTESMTLRLERTFATLAKLRRYHGHFYNWYDLRDLRVLDPPYVSTVDSGNIAGHLIAVRQACIAAAGGTRDETLKQRLLFLSEQAYSFVMEMDFTFLYDRTRKLFTIGYHPESFTADNSFYDLLASEARQASLVAIARNDVPVEHWFRLSRALTRTAGSTSLVSWSGSMFEYLMPVLVMRSLPFTILDQTYRSVIDRQVGYARSRGVPWGMSESAYNVRDHHHTYQYRAFGIPDLALKLGLERDLTIAPYASSLAAMIDPPRALANLRTLEGMGALGEYGFCDALDYTRADPGSRFAVVQAYMAHHLGMTLVSLTNILLDDIWQARFHADPLIKSVELLLHERVPRRLVLHEAQRVGPGTPRQDVDNIQSIVREVDTSVATEPRVVLLGAQPYTVMVNHSGSGFSKYESIAVTRWRPDLVRDDSGQFCYVKDITTGRVWSASHQPVCATASWSRAWLAPDRVTLHRSDDTIETRTEITVVPADAAEVRRVTLTNTGSEAHEIELTSYGEIVMGPPDADRAHPAFSNLFVETEWHEWCTAITAARRPRAPEDPHLWCVHVVDAGADRIGSVSCETDRGRFIGRGRTLRDPFVMEADAVLSGTTGPVLDPIFALRTRVRVSPGQSVSVAFTTIVATNRESAFALADRYHDSHAAERALDLAWTTTQIRLRELGITPRSAAVFHDLAAQLLYPGGSLSPPPDALSRNRGSQARLWAHGISGDLPIILATIGSLDGLATLRELFAAHRYWRRRGLDVDLVVVNTHPHDYLQDLRDGINEAMVAANDAIVDRPGGVFVRRHEVFQADDYLMLYATARVHVPCTGRSLTRLLTSADADRADRPASTRVESDLIVDRGASGATVTAERSGPLASIVGALRPYVAPLLPRAGKVHDRRAHATFAVESLRFDNGIGGLHENGDYYMVVDDSHLPPAPWSNVVANAQGGFLVTERGSGCTWAQNAHFYRLTPWHNDPVCDPTSDVLFLQDRDNDDLWSATPAPVRGDGPYRVRHGAGSTTFEHVHDDIATELLLGLPKDAAVKVSRLRVTNRSGRTRRITLTAFVEWTLGTQREATQEHVRTDFVSDANAILAQNHFDPHFCEWTAFLASSEPVTSYTGDRKTFVGPGGNIARPAALLRDEGRLDGTTGVALDPCAALQMRLELPPGESREVTLLLGAAPSAAEARRTLDSLRSAEQRKLALSLSHDAWTDRLGTITVHTPDPAFDAMLNRWTLYQALSCRMWARMGLYQSSGAYGFRDQLQDVMALLYAEPQIAREHIIRAAARQFVEGDVQHWWHAHSGRGVRTRFSDDLAWLPYVVDRYLRVTGDMSVLDEQVPFLEMRTLEPDEHEIYDLPGVTHEVASVYEHCVRALRRACTVGRHGLPLIGTGDWNDGLNRVGAGGQGESVWLAWFLVATLRSFADHVAARGERNRADEMRRQAADYTAAVEANGWDGDWYLRAWYDDGTPLGSAKGDEARIDSIAQSWSVISGAGRAERQEQAMKSLHEHLVREDARLMILLTPPFDKGTHDPGYIKGYVTGVRENGAQYTHAALWAVMATALRGDGDKAFGLFQWINPLNRTSNAAGMERYKVEPYVVAADVYSTPSQLGRGGWTWYTGSASWMYRVGLEHILGFTKIGNTLRMNPCVPRSWTEFSITYRFGKSVYSILVRNPAGLRDGRAQTTLDGQRLADNTIPLVDDGKSHDVVVQAPLALQADEVA